MLMFVFRIIASFLVKTFIQTFWNLVQKKQITKKVRFPVRQRNSSNLIIKPSTICWRPLTWQECSFSLQITLVSWFSTMWCVFFFFNRQMKDWRRFSSLWFHICVCVVELMLLEPFEKSKKSRARWRCMILFYIADIGEKNHTNLSRMLILCFWAHNKNV